MRITVVAEVAAVALNEVTPDGQGARLDLGRCLGNQLLVLYHNNFFNVWLPGKPMLYHSNFGPVPHIVTEYTTMYIGKPILRIMYQ